MVLKSVFLVHWSGSASLGGYCTVLQQGHLGFNILLYLKPLIAFDCT